MIQYFTPAGRVLWNLWGMALDVLWLGMGWLVKSRWNQKSTLNKIVFVRPVALALSTSQTS